MISNQQLARTSGCNIGPMAPGALSDVRASAPRPSRPRNCRQDRRNREQRDQHDRLRLGVHRIPVHRRDQNNAQI
eukprot:11177580-Lingulodinium_polyedra.AAC.1